MSFKLSTRKASEIRIGDRVVPRDGRRRFVANIITDKADTSVRVIYDDGDETIAAPWADLTVATWHEEETSA